ncbi:Fungal specific transcription factor [Colletotrichum higginsianum IMI 349063]|uniref:Fungal specific transcription factor n=2 Tax=Colletotrichum higginsianum TaxID=80884 RepID=A0A1B7Y939_COLHI|nr:Fungal specific transcription factor [Colletotrichum higginsianum IMI 349063]OBR08500.1 Fungal specific transcription factor [Colletotrichum higginsianum IMI 349063]
MPQSSKSEGKRRHVTTACTFCRESKIKMPTEEAKSLVRILNTLGLDTVLAAPEQKETPPVIDPVLSQETTPPLALPAPTWDHVAQPGQLPSGLSFSFDPETFGLFGHAGVQPQPAQRPLLNTTARSIADWEWSPDEDDHSRPPRVDIASVRAPSHPLLSTYSEEAALSDNDDEDDAGSDTTEEDLLNQLSDRLGSMHIDPNGRISYFGPTSNFRLVELPAGSDTLSVDRTVRNDGQEHLDKMGLGKPVPPDLEEHLISLYFAWQDPYTHVVDRALYEEAKHNWISREEETPYYSEALKNAMCCLGAAFEPRYHPNFVTFPKSLPIFFAARAMVLLEIELDSPSVSTVQTMVVLSSHEIGANRDSRGWLCSGTAIRLAFDLALHKDMTPYVEKGILTPAEAELRRAIFWGAYTMDQALGFHRGRPFRISMDDITVQKPRKTSLHEPVTHWAAYTSSQNRSNPPCSLVDCVDDVCFYKIELCEIVAPLGHTLYGNSKIPLNILQEISEKVVTRLFLWKESLPQSLQVDPEDANKTHLPHVLLLHMQYYQNVIHTHRPWMSSSYIQPQPPQGPGYMHAQRMCIKSATAIAKLIQTYERQFSLRRVNVQSVAIVFSAAILLIFASMSRRRRRRTAETTTHLSMCFRALEELSASWDCAKRARDFLLMLQRKWELRSRRLSPGARDPAPASYGCFVRPGEHMSRKRVRTGSPVGPHPQSVDGFQNMTPAQQGGLPAEDQREYHEGINLDMRLDLDWVFGAGAQSIPGHWDGLLPPGAMFFEDGAAS